MGAPHCGGCSLQVSSPMFTEWIGMDVLHEERKNQHFEEFQCELGQTFFLYATYNIHWVQHTRYAVCIRVVFKIYVYMCIPYIYIHTLCTIIFPYFHTDKVCKDLRSYRSFRVPAGGNPTSPWYSAVVTFQSSGCEFDLDLDSMVIILLGKCYIFTHSSIYLIPYIFPTKILDISQKLCEFQSGSGFHPGIPGLCVHDLQGAEWLWKMLIELPGLVMTNSSPWKMAHL